MLDAMARSLLFVLVGLTWLAACDDDASVTSSAGSGGTGQGAGEQGGSSEGGTSQGGAGASATGGAGGEVVLPTGDARFDYQLGGDYPPPDGVAIVVRDRGAPPAAGLYNVCYVNGFQAQQEDGAWWLDNHPTLVLRDGGGDPIIDPDWDEMLLDTSTPEKREALAVIVGDFISGCGDDGYDAVEIDNLDSYTRSSDLLEEQDAVDFMALLSERAHAAGMAIAQKNATELVARRAEMGTDFAVAEECNRYTECQDYVDGYGDHVLIIEYRKQDFDAGCSDFPNLSIVYRDLELVTPSDGAYLFDDC